MAARRFVPEVRHGRENLADFRRKAREAWVREWKMEAIRARRFTGEETFKQGLDLIKLAIQIHEAGERARNR